MITTDSTLTLAGQIVSLCASRLAHIPAAECLLQVMRADGAKVLGIEVGEDREVGPKYPGPPVPVLTLRPKYRLWRRLGRPYYSNLLAVYTFVLTRLYQGERPMLLLGNQTALLPLLWLARRLFQVPYVACMYEPFEPRSTSRLNRLLGRCEGRFLRAAKAVVFPSAARAQFYQIWFGLKAPTVVLANAALRRGPPTANVRLRAELGIPKGALALLYLGGVSADKYLAEAVRALALSAHNNVYLVIVGWAEPVFHAELMRLAQDLGLTERVKILPASSRKWDYYSACDVGYCAYAPTGLTWLFSGSASSKLNEYLAAGLAVLTSENDSLANLVRRYGCGECCAADDPAALAAAIDRLLVPAALARYKKAAYAAHLDEFNMETQFARSRDVFLRAN